MTETELIRKLEVDKAGAFKELVEKYQRYVLVTARGFVKNDEDARDLSQEVFIKIYNSLGQFRKESGLSTWIYRITVNLSINYLRDNKKYRDTGSIDIQPAGGEVPDKTMENLDRAKFLHQAIDSLPENQRKVFILSKYDDLSYKEIAEVMEMSIPKVESLLFRAKKNLQKKLWNCYKKMC